MSMIHDEPLPGRVDLLAARGRPRSSCPRWCCPCVQPRFMEYSTWSRRIADLAGAVSPAGGGGRRPWESRSPGVDRLACQPVPEAAAAGDRGPVSDRRRRRGDEHRQEHDVQPPGRLPGQPGPSRRHPDAGIRSACCRRVLCSVTTWPGSFPASSSAPGPRRTTPVAEGPSNRLIYREDPTGAAAAEPGAARTRPTWTAQSP